MLEKNNFTIGFYKKMLKTNEMIKVLDSEDVYESVFVFGLKKNPFFQNKNSLFHGDIFYVKEKKEYVVFNFKFNRETGSVKQYGFSFFEKSSFFNKFYSFNEFKDNFSNCSFKFIGNVFIHQNYLFANFLKEINISNIFYNLQINEDLNHFKVTLEEKNTILFSLNKERIDKDKRVLFKSLNYPSSSFNFKTEKEVVYIHETKDKKIIYKELIQGYDGSIYYLIEYSLEEDKIIENPSFMLLINNGSPIIINANLKEVQQIPSPFMEENWSFIERENKEYKKELLNFIS